MTIHAFTELHSNYPAYVNLSEQKDGTIKLSVRTRGNGGKDYATIDLTAAQAEELADSIYKHVYKGEASAFPERDQSKPAEQQGIFRKFEVRRVDGSDQPGGKHHGCRYYVLDLDHDPHAGPAMAAYAESCRFSHHQLSDELRAEFGAAPVAEAPTEQQAVFRKAKELLPKLHSLFNRLRNPSNIRVKCEEDSRIVGDASELCRTILNAPVAAPATEQSKEGGLLLAEKQPNSTGEAIQNNYLSMAEGRPPEQAKVWLEFPTFSDWLASPIDPPTLPHRSPDLSIQYARLAFNAARQGLAAQASPAKPDLAGLVDRVKDAWSNYERMGEVCSFEGNSMIYASTLEEIHEVLLAAITKEQTK